MRFLRRCWRIFRHSPPRENEFDTGRAGKPRPMRGILERLTEEQRKAALGYVEPEAVKHAQKRVAA